MGGRSRVAAQQLAGEGFTKVINLSGGIKAWNGQEAFGPVDQGMELFETLTSGEMILETAYSLEEGLQDFYNKMTRQVQSSEVADLFKKLARVEDLHKDRLFDEYSRLTGSFDRNAFVKKIEQGNLEGGMTTEEYLDRFQPDLDKPEEVISLAMSIEAQALDLYTRAAQVALDGENKKILARIAAEEKIHLEHLGTLLDSIMEKKNG